MNNIKNNRNQYYVYKINVNRFKEKKWNLTLTPNEARQNEEVVKLAESQVIRFINEIKCSSFPDNEHKRLLRKISRLRKEKRTLENSKIIKESYKILDKNFFLEDYIFVEMNTPKDYELASNRGFKLNDKKFYRLYTTSGGGKKGIVVFASESVYVELSRKLENNRNEEIPLVPAKYEAYKALASSASIPVSLLNKNSVAVIRDYEHDIYKDVTLIHNNAEMTIEEKENHKLKVNVNDGFGFISYRLAEHWSKELGLDYVPSGFCVRFAFTKGMLFVFDYHDFANIEAKTNTYTDVWDNTYDNIEDIDIVLTSSMVKLSKCYTDIHQFMNTSFDNGYTFSVTKTTPKKLENERNLTYQYIQSLNLSDEDIRKLIKSTVDFISEARGRDWMKSLLFLKGTHLTDANMESLEFDFAQALMLCPEEMINDPFVRGHLNKMTEKTIREAKIGKIRVTGNYQTLTGDPYALAQSMFKLPVTGLLKDGEFYSHYWNERNVSLVAGFRAPMSCHENIRILNLINNDKVSYWYKYLNTVLILNAWDTTTHALNGADFDGDLGMTTDNPIIIKGITPKNAIICEQGTTSPIIVTESSLIKANQDSKGNDIGSITNRATAMYDLLPMFKKDSQQYTLLSNRIKRCQKLQQDSIDRAKGIQGFKMPKEWHEYNSNVKRDGDSIIERNELNLEILADKNPYFLRFRYDHIDKEYRKYEKANKRNCEIRFGIELDDLINKEQKSDEEQKFLDYYHKNSPVTFGRSTMNRLCWNIEYEFKRKPKEKRVEFDYGILKSVDVSYDEETFNKIRKLYEEYIAAVQYYEAKTDSWNEDDEEVNVNQRNILVERFQRYGYEICSNEDELCNIVLDLVYSKGDSTKNSKEKSKQFAWDIAGETIISNLKKRSNFIIYYVELEPTGDIEFCGERFVLKTKNINENEVIV